MNVPATSKDATSRLVDLEHLDLHAYLRAHIKWLHGRVDNGNAAAVCAVVDEWERSLGVSLGDTVSELALLRRFPDFVEYKNALAGSTSHLAGPLLKLAQAMEAGNSRSIARWRWAACAYGRWLSSFVEARRQAFTAASNFRRAAEAAIQPVRRRSDVLTVLLGSYARELAATTGTLQHRSLRLQQVCQRQDVLLRREERVRERAETLDSRLRQLGEHVFCDRARSEERSARAWLLRLRQAERHLTDRRRDGAVIDQLKKTQLSLQTLG
jgi:hypothetical protein